MKYLKHLLPVLFLCWLLAVNAPKAEAATYTGSYGDKVTYSLDTETGVMTFSGSGTMRNIGGGSTLPWYNYRSYVKSVIVEEGITSVGMYTFGLYEHPNLKSVSLPESLSMIRQGAFRSCKALETVVIPDGTTVVEADAFLSCSRLKELTIGKGVTQFAGSALTGCISLENVIYRPEALPNSGSLFPAEASFQLIIADTVRKIPDYLCYQSGVTSVVFGSGLESIGSYAFAVCPQLTEIQIPDSVNSIGGNAFMSSRNLASVQLPDGLTNIANTLFYSCDALETIDIPDTVQTIGDYAFEYSGLTEVEIPASVTTIGTYVFNRCESLQRCVWPGSLTEIPENTFSYCTALQEFAIPNTVTSIGEEAFLQSGLTSVTLPSSITVIGAKAFENCSALRNIRFDIDSITSYAQAFNGAGSANGCVLTIGDSITDIPGGLMYGSQVSSVVWGKNVTKIGAGAFGSCTKLTELILEDSVTEVGSKAFFGCTGLTSITLGEGLCAIKEQAFASCTAVTALSFGAPKINSVGNQAFSNLGSGSSGVVATFRDTVEVVPAELFNANGSTSTSTNIKKISLGNSVLYVGKWGNYAFSGELEELRVNSHLTNLEATVGAGTVVYGWDGSIAEKVAGNSGSTFVSLGSRQWKDSISEADMPPLDETTNTLTISTPRHLAWLSWMTGPENGYTLSGYRIKLANHIDMGGKLWEPLVVFAGELDGGGYTISNLEIADGSFLENLTGSVSNLYLADMKLTGYYCLTSTRISTDSVFNCGASVRALSMKHINYVYSGTPQNSYCVAIDINGNVAGTAYSADRTKTTTTNSADYKTTEFLASLNTLMEGAMMWEFGTDGYPVLLPNSSRSWKDHAVAVTPQDDIYYISTPGELAYIGNLVNNGNSLAGKTVRLMADLDLSGKAWTPIGEENTPFSGVFDGADHTISNLMVGTEKKPVNGYAGLFGYCDSYGELKNVTLKDVAVYGSYAGALVGAGRDITNCHVNGGIVSGYSAGGLAQSATKLQHCSAMCVVIGTSDVGGLVGRMENYGGFSHCYAVCDVTGTAARVGGLVGFYQQATEELMNCYAIGTVSGKSATGGLVGNAVGNISSCYAVCDISAVDSLPGMLVGGMSYNDRYKIKDCYWSSDNTMKQSGIIRTPQGTGNLTDDGSVGKSLAELKKQTTFTNWDFADVWAISSEKNSGLPYLQAFDSVEIPLTGLTISAQTCSVPVGNVYWLTVTPEPAAAAAQVTWSSSNPAVASVSGGKVTGLSVGETTITAACGSFTVRCTVTVTARPMNEYTVDKLTLRNSAGAALTEIPTGSFYAEATITKTAEAGNAIVMLVTYTAQGKLLDTIYVQADVPVGTTYSVGAWIDHDKGTVGQVKVFLLSSLDNPLPVAASKMIS